MDVPFGAAQNTHDAQITHFDIALKHSERECRVGQCGFANGGIVRQGTFLKLRLGNELLRESVGLYRNNIDKTLSVLGGNAEVLEKGEHVLPDGFVMFIDQAPVFGFAPHFRLADTGENGTEDFFAQNDQCANLTDGFRWNRVSARLG